MVNANAAKIPDIRNTDIRNIWARTELGVIPAHNDPEYAKARLWFVGFIFQNVAAIGQQRMYTHGLGLVMAMGDDHPTVRG